MVLTPLRGELGTSQAVAGIGSATVLTAMPISDGDIPHVSHISDSDETRFQLPVSVFGYLKVSAAARNHPVGGGDLIQPRS